MRLITIARKPLTESVARNILAHGTGGLNIEACRVAGAPELPGSAHINPEDKQSFGKHWNESAGRRAAAYIANPPSGRWPANLILQHDSGCRLEGSQKIKAIDARRNPAKQTGAFFGGTTQHIVGPRGYSDPDGKETVDKWECVEGCPVKELAEQGGVQHTHAGCYRRPGTPGCFGVAGRIGTIVSQGEIGFVGRFFKQVQGKGKGD